MSHDRTSPRFSIRDAIAKLLPPGAAHTSSTRIPGCAPAHRAASAAAASCTYTRPSQNAASFVRSPAPSASIQSGSHGCGVRRTPAAVSSSQTACGCVLSGLYCSVIGAGALSAAKNASSVPSGRFSRKSATSAAGWLYFVSRSSGCLRLPFCRESERSTPLTSPAARRFP